MAELLKLGGLGNNLITHIPKELRNQKLTCDEFSEQIRYTFGSPFTHAGIPFAYGTNQMPLLKHFTLAFICAFTVLDVSKFEEYKKYLFNPEKHADALLEMRPLLSAIKPIGIEHEVIGRDSKTIDWKFIYDELEILLEVKNRTGNTYEHLIEISQRQGHAGAPNTNAERFFKSTFTKFNKIATDITLQGIWIHIGIKENRAILDKYFEEKIDPTEMNFFIICGWENECYIKTRNKKQKQILLEKFRLIESDRFVF